MKGNLALAGLTERERVDQYLSMYVSAMAEDMAFNELYGMGYLNGREYADKILEVRRQDVERVAREYLNPDIRSEIAVGPPESLKLIDKP